MICQTRDKKTSKEMEASGNFPLIGRPFNFPISGRARLAPAGKDTSIKLDWKQYA